MTTPERLRRPTTLKGLLLQGGIVVALLFGGMTAVDKVLASPIPPPTPDPQCQPFGSNRHCFVDPQPEFFSTPTPTPLPTHQTVWTHRGRRGGHLPR